MAEAYVIEEKAFPEATVVSIRTKDSLKAMGKYIRELYGLARQKGLKPDGPIFTEYFEAPTDQSKVDYAMHLPVEGDTAELDKLEDIGGDPCLCLRVKGSYSKLAAAYKSLTDYIAAKGYEMSGPPREVYARSPFLGIMALAVTDIYFPVKAK
jgi:Transcriptional regulator, effector-binding domain/component